LLLQGYLLKTIGVSAIEVLRKHEKGTSVTGRLLPQPSGVNEMNFEYSEKNTERTLLCITDTLW